MKKLTIAITLILVVATVALAGPKGKKYGKHTIHGMGYDKAAIEKLLDDSEVPGEVTAYAWGIRKVNGKFKLDRAMKVEDAAVDFIDQHRNAFKLKAPKKELKLIRKENHKKGNIHVRYQQTYNGIPVWGQEIIVHINKEHELDHVIADNVPTPDIDTTPLISEEEAMAIVVKDLDNRAGGKAVLRHLSPPEVSLVIYSDQLAYKVWLGVDEPFGDWMYFVNAKNGGIISSEDTMRY